MGRPTCYRCFRPEVGCICGLVRRVDNRTHVLIVQHPRERKHPFGTARIARLGLAKVEVMRAEKEYPDGEMWVPHRDVGNAAVLFPSRTATTLGEGEPVSLDTLVVIDGTWSEAQKLLHITPWMRALPCVSLSPPRPGNYRIRKAKNPALEVSTIEAIAYALGHLEPGTPGIGGLVEDFDAVIDHQISLQAGRFVPRVKKK